MTGDCAPLLTHKKGVTRTSVSENGPSYTAPLPLPSTAEYSGDGEAGSAPANLDVRRNAGVEKDRIRLEVSAQNGTSKQSENSPGEDLHEESIGTLGDLDNSVTSAITSSKGVSLQHLPAPSTIVPEGVPHRNNPPATDQTSPHTSSSRSAEVPSLRSRWVQRKLGGLAGGAASRSLPDSRDSWRNDTDRLAYPLDKPSEPPQPTLQVTSPTSLPPHPKDTEDFPEKVDPVTDDSQSSSLVSPTSKALPPMPFLVAGRATFGSSAMVLADHVGSPTTTHEESQWSSEVENADKPTQEKGLIGSDKWSDKIRRDRTADVFARIKGLEDVKVRLDRVGPRNLKALISIIKGITDLQTFPIPGGRE